MEEYSYEMTNELRLKVDQFLEDLESLLELFVVVESDDLFEHRLLFVGKSFEQSVHL